MENIPPKFLKKFNKQQILKMYEICKSIIHVFDDLNVADFDNLIFADVLNCVKKLDGVYYKYTGDENEIGENYNSKIKVLRETFGEVKRLIIKKNNSLLEIEELRSEILTEVCSRISYIIFIASKGVDHAS